ncbi:MAG: response regulator [Lachnospiraceae bacterium]|nr:response regulator [Lachnospiraceae bacterium]
MKNRNGFREAIKTMGVRSVLALTLVFLLTFATTCTGGFLFYRSAKERIQLRGRVNAVQSAKEFDSYLLVRKNTIILAGHVVDEMIRTKQPNSEVMDYLTAESLSIKKSIDKDFTGLYGWINGEYCDGDGWVPDDDYVPTERPWYLETMADDSDVTFVKPYLDDQTKTVLTTMALCLSDGVSVIAMDVNLSRIQDITGEIAQLTPGGYGIVLDKDGRVIAHSDANELGKSYLEESGTLGAALVKKLYGSQSNEFELGFGGERYMVFVEEIEGGWLSLSLVNTKAVYGPLVVILSMMVLLTVLEVVVFIAVIRNQSEKNRAIASAEAAQSANRAKSLFLSRMSHEIRTPINAIIGLVSIVLRDESISERTRDGLSKIGASARHLLSLVNDILDMSRIESGKTALKEQQFSLKEFIEEINIIVGGQCEEKGLRFVCKEDESLDEYYVGDNLKLKQIIINILGNSVKFTDPPGVITFTVEQTRQKDNKATLCFTMEDTGIGMDKDYIPKLFDAFTQEDARNTTRYGGSGLGMAITKSYTDMMGGDIKVESEKGVGSKFTVSVTLEQVHDVKPQKALEDGSPIEDEEISLAGLHVMIVEDQELNAEVLHDLLDLEDVSSEWARNGQVAIELFERNEEGHYDAIFMDMRMPVMDGLAATRAIRMLKRPDAASIPIIALSANAFEEDVRQCLEAGMNEHLSKPVDLDRLKDSLKEIVIKKQVGRKQAS